MLRVSEPIFGGNEKKYLCEAIDAGEVSSGGSFVQRFEEAFAKWSGNKYAIAVSSGTAALECAVWALKLKEIAIPTGTIFACAIAAARAGARIHLHDNTNVMAENLMRCHLFGAIDESTGINVVDDLSQYWKPYTVGDVGCYSLYANKLITSGEGGVVITNRYDIAERVRSYRNLCHSHERFVHHDIGYNFRMSNIQAAVALAQLEQIDRFTEIKRHNRDLFLLKLPDNIHRLFNVDVPWMYLIQTHKPAGAMVHALADEGIECRRFFFPIHKQPVEPIPYQAREVFPIAEALWDSAFYIPSGLTLEETQIDYVCQKLRELL